MPNRTVILPSGLSGEVRGLRTREANMLADAKNARAGTSFDQILAACWVSTQSPGPYAVKADGSFAWGDVLVCDRTAAIMAIRVATYGSEYVFSVRCASETCLKKFDWALDLVQDITTKPLPAESLVTFAKDNRFESMLPGLGRKFWFKLQTGRDEQRASAAAKMNKERIVTFAINMRITEIEGVHANDQLRFLEDLEMADTMAVLSQLDAVDGGVETDLEVQCEHCGEVQGVALPFGREFFMARKRAPLKTMPATA